MTTDQPKFQRWQINMSNGTFFWIAMLGAVFIAARGPCKAAAPHPAPSTELTRPFQNP